MRKSLLIICGIVLAICLWLLLHRRTKAPSVLYDGQAVAVAATNQNPATPLKAAVAAPAPTTVAPNPPTSNAPNAINPTIKELLQKPIDFYGKVLDEGNNPVAGANVQFRWDDLTAENWTRTSTTESDVEGLFSLHDKHGATLTVSISKEGYYTPHSGQGSFHYAFGNPNFSSDPQNPIIFYLRKKGKGESLIEKDFPPGMGQIWQLHHDGTPIELDLLKGAQVPAGSGQLKLEFWRDLSDRKARVFDWKCQLSVIGGGLVETPEEFAFETPESGYQPSIVIDMPATNQNWQGEIRSKCYIQIANGNYGRIDFYLLAYNGVFTVHSVINPTGSRNLEPQ